MIQYIVTKNYGWGHNVEYDPRFPGYFSADFEIKGVYKRISNLTKRDIVRISERVSLEANKSYGEIKSGETYSIDKLSCPQNGSCIYYIFTETFEYSNYTEDELKSIFDLSKMMRFTY